ncbi:hypothetical protein S40293_02778 [Stachybotrys chartarum IBT 40293]|nr:hypothetical protein S40293_02778 [Stachybotrys chartarum IBT 40293]
MAGKKGGENSKKAVGNARKADAAAQKAAAEDAKQAAAEAEEWQKGAKSNAKKEAEAAKKAEQAKKKAEKDALMAEEEANVGGRAEPKKTKAPVKKSRGLDLSQLDGDSPSALNASGIDNALDALTLAGGSDDSKIDKHPERRFPAAFAKYEARRLDEMKKDGSGVGLRLDQRKQRIRKEFEKSPENPFNQVTASYNVSKSELAEIKAKEMAKIEQRLGNSGLKQACPQGVFVAITPDDPALWSAVLFVRQGPYAPAVLRFHISFPDSYPTLPPLVTFSTEMFHPLITPSTTYMYTTDIQDNGTVSATDDERLPPGGFSLRHGFPDWFGRGKRSSAPSSRQASGQHAATTPDRLGPAAQQASPESAATAATSVPSYMRTDRRTTSTYDVLGYIKSAFDSEQVLNAVPLDAAGNPGAWHAWRTHQRNLGKLPADQGQGDGAATPDDPKDTPVPVATRRPGEWNWEGVWEDRVKKNIASSLSESVLYGTAGTDDIIRFLSMEGNEVESIQENIQRTLESSLLLRREYHVEFIAFTYRSSYDYRHIFCNAESNTIKSHTIPRRDSHQVHWADHLTPPAIDAMPAETSSRHTCNERTRFMEDVVSGRCFLPSTQRVSGKPSPLRIIKRHQSHEGHVAHGSSRSTSGSTGSAAVASAGADWSLTVSKKRGSGTLHALGRRQAKCASEDVELRSREGAESVPVMRMRRQRRPSILELVGQWKSRSSSGSDDVPSIRCSAQAATTRFAEHQGAGAQDATPGPASLAAPYVLSPFITIDSSTTGLDHGQCSVWVAIEVSGRLSQASTLQSVPGMATGSFIGNTLDRFFEYGCLYDLSIDIVPMPGTRVVQVLGEQHFPTTIHAGSSILLVVQVCLEQEAVRRPTHAGHRRQRSEELIEDLELELGDTRVEYMQIRVTYSHSAFPDHCSPGTSSGVSNIRTRMETTATATLKLYNELSPWSPRPAPAPHPLLELIERH